MEVDKQLENLVIRCQDGQRAAFEELFEMYQPRLKVLHKVVDSGLQKKFRLT